jgi:small conductance mechanosensitive channel
MAKIVQQLLERIAHKASWDKTLVSFVGNLAYAGMMIFVILAALGQIGVETTSFIAVLGAAGLAIGLSLQGSLSNFAAGFMMILFKPFKVGDLVEIASTLRHRRRNPNIHHSHAHW